MKLDFDLHVHTHHSPCGREEMIPADIVRTAADRGITHLAITDHLYTFTDRGMFDRIRAGVAQARAGMNGSPQVYFGCEVEVMAPGRPAGGPELAEELDFLMAGTTHFQNAGITDLPKARDERSIGLHYLRMFEYAASLPWMDVIAHPFYVVPGVCPVSVLHSISKEDLLPALRAARKNGIAVEISRRALGPGQPDFSLPFYKLCKEMGLKFTIGSDAHTLDMVGNLAELQPVVAYLELTEQDFWLPERKDRL